MTATPPPSTTWAGGQQQEYNQTGNPDLLAENGNFLITESSNNIVLEDVSVVTLPATTWTVDDSE